MPKTRDVHQAGKALHGKNKTPTGHLLDDVTRDLVEQAVEEQFQSGVSQAETLRRVMRGRGSPRSAPSQMVL